MHASHAHAVPAQLFARAVARAMLAIVVAVAASALAPPPARAADPTKVIRDVFPVAETGFDPAGVHDLYSGTIVQAIHETLYTYDYLARPSKVVPLTAEALPEVTDGGRTWRVRLRKGIHFAPDPAFKGRKRELVAADYLYSLQRLIDPKLRSPWAFLVEGKFASCGRKYELASSGTSAILTKAKPKRAGSRAFGRSLKSRSPRRLRSSRPAPPRSAPRCFASPRKAPRLAD